MGSLGMPLGASRLPGLLLIGLVIAGLVVAVYRGVTSPEAKTRRGRLRETGWNLALVAVSLLMLSASGRYLGKPWVLVVLPAAALGFLLARPRWTRRLVAAGLIALGLYGF